MTNYGSLFKTWIIFIFFFFSILKLNAQDLLKGNDLSQIKVESISTSDLLKLKSQLQSAGIGLEQAEQLAISKGMPAAEAQKLKLRLTTVSQNNLDSKEIQKNSNQRENVVNEPVNENKNGKTNPLINPLIFGSELYSSTSLSFEPNLKLATPINYILGPEDQIQISVFGVQEYNGNHTVSPEGTVNIPNIGEVKLAGISIEAATQKLKILMGKSVYSYLKTGEAKLTVSLSKIRTITITIIGSNKPGNYKVSSLTSVFNALYLAGGPSEFGSFREIELIRNNKLERKIDLYHFLLEGTQIDNVSLKDNDVIRIPVYKSRIEIKGEVKRPGIFEILPNENFSQLLAYASGFTDLAYMNSVKIFQRNDKERQIQDLNNQNFSTYLPKSGDVFEVSRILDRYKNKLSIKGAVYRPDIYEFKEGLSLLELIKKADGLKPDAYLDRAQIIRLKDDLTRTILSVDLKKVVLGELSNNIQLQKEDEIVILSVNDLKDKSQITIQGEIRKPGNYDFIEKITLKDLILQAGGFTNAAIKKVEIASLLKRDTLFATDNQSSKIIKTEIHDFNLSTSDEANIILNPFDVVTIHRVSGYILPESVFITGQIQFPGPYSLESSVERVSDLLKRAGGFLSSAFPEGAYLKRFKSEVEKEKANETVDNLLNDKIDSTGQIKKKLLKEYDKIPVDFMQILKNPGSIEDFLLKAGDELIIPKFESLVRISGEVLMSTQVPYINDNSFKSYINAAGGFKSEALKKKSFVVYANGMASSTKSFLFFKKYPKIKPGSEIVIPKKRDKKASGFTEIIGVTSVLVSLVTAFAILKN